MLLRWNYLTLIIFWNVGIVQGQVNARLLNSVSSSKKSNRKMRQSNIRARDIVKKWLSECYMASYNSRHPSVLTRPPTKAMTATPKTTATTTTPEPPEVEESENEVTTHAMNRRRNMKRVVYNTYAQNDYFNRPDMYRNFYNYAQYGGGNGGGEEISEQYEADEHVPTTTYSWWLPLLPRQALTTSTTTTTTTTEAPTTPEAEEAEGVVKTSGDFNSPSSRGLCFCSPLSSCPRASVPRGGMCSTFLFRYVFKGSYMRCCYRPSLAKTIGVW